MKIEWSLLGKSIFYVAGVSTYFFAFCMWMGKACKLDMGNIPPSMVSGGEILFYIILTLNFIIITYKMLVEKK